MPRGSLLVSWLLTLLVQDSVSALRKIKMPSRSWIHRLDEVYIPPQYTVSLSMGVGVPLFTQVISNCSVSHYGDGALVIVGHKCTQVPTIDTAVLGGPPLAIALYHSSIGYLAERAFANYSPTSHITAVEVIQNKITTIKPRAFDGLSNVTFLSLTDNPILFLFEESFSGLKNLKELVLFRTRITDISEVIRSIVPSVLPKLEVLNLGGTPIWAIGRNSFEPLVNSSLKHVQLHLCDNLTYVHPLALSHLSHLEGVYFRDNINMSMQNLEDVISNITQDTFQIIDISQSDVYKGIPYNILRAVARTTAEVVILARSTQGVVSRKNFPLLSKVKYLLMPATKIKVFRPNSFDNLPNLEGLAFDRNQFADVPLGVRMPRLKVLDLSGYDRGFIQLDLGEGVFAEMSNLKELLIRYRVLPSFTENTFKGLKNLEYLNLKKCSIDSLPRGVFRPLKNLRHLDLSENPLFSAATASARVVLRGMIRLETLLLSQTELVGLEESIALQDMVYLKHLDVSNNSIATVSENALSKNPLLEHLDLSMNHIDQWSVRNTSIAGLRILDLSHNKFRTFSAETMQNFERLSLLDLSMNPYRCTCNLQPFLSWLTSTKVTIHAIAYTQLYRCSSPESFHGTHILSLRSSLHNLCQPSIIIIAACVVLLLLVFSALLAGGLIYKRSLQRWLSHPPHESCMKNKCYLYDAFVSYSNNDTSWVFNTLLPRLENSAIGNLKLCVYDRDFVAGRNISECILDSIKHSRKIILVLSNSFLQSPWCRFEADLAQYTLLEDNRDSFILLKLGALDARLISPKLNYLLRSRIHLVWSQSAKDETVFFSKLRRALENKINGSCEETQERKKQNLVAVLKSKSSLV